MADSEEDFLVNYEFGHYIWTSILNSPYIDWTEDDQLDYAASSPYNSERYKRNGGNDYPSPAEWVTGGVGLPLAVNLDHQTDYKRLTPDSTNIGGRSTTTLGTRYWFEFRQDSGDVIPGEGLDVHPVDANPLRIPAPEEWRDEIREWARSYPRGEITRVKSAVFEERFAEAGFDGTSHAGKTHQDFHVKIPGIEDRDTLRQVWDESVELVQRIVRSER